MSPVPYFLLGVVGVIVGVGVWNLTLHDWLAVGGCVFVAWLLYTVLEYLDGLGDD